MKQYFDVLRRKIQDSAHADLGLVVALTVGVGQRKFNKGYYNLAEPPRGLHVSHILI